MAGTFERGLAGSSSRTSSVVDAHPSAAHVPNSTRLRAASERADLGDLDPIALKLFGIGELRHAAFGMRVPSGIVVAREIFAHLHQREHSAHRDVIEWSLRAFHRD